VKRKIWLGFFLAPFVATAAPTAVDPDALQWAEKEQEIRARALGERIGRLKEQIREKGLRFHALDQGPRAVLHVWEDDDADQGTRQKVKRLIRLSVRSQLSELSLLSRRLSEVESEREWIRAQIHGLPAAMLAANAAPAASTGASAPFACAGFPVASGESGEAPKILQDYGRRRDPETGIEWRSTGWWLSPGSERFVKACAPGKVIYSGLVPGRRRVVMLEHRSGAITVYANLREDVGPATGAVVRAGDSLGEIVERLYFEVRAKGAAVDPREAFSGAQLASLFSRPAG